MRCLRADALLATGGDNEGLAELHRLIGGRPTWATVLASLVAKGLVALPEGVDHLDEVLPGPVQL
jgi:hypothetical protein